MPPAQYSAVAISARDEPKNRAPRAGTGRPDHGDGAGAAGFSSSRLPSEASRIARHCQAEGPRADSDQFSVGFRWTASMTSTSMNPLPRSNLKPRFFRAFGSDSSDKA